jgi:alkanesulfonate monooxygenase SsuD/methylene tetrahydromethanopterin reductase-like flavin-dependent oxidoreductase (luciferase family)
VRPWTAAEEAFRSALRSRAFVGTGAQVVQQLRALADALDIDEVVVITWTWDPDAQRRSYELLAQAAGLQAA